MFHVIHLTWKTDSFSVPKSDNGVSGETDRTVAFGFQGEGKDVKPGYRVVTFTKHLEAGPIILHTWFEDELDQPICGAYYVYVERMSEWKIEWMLRCEMSYLGWVMSDEWLYLINN